MATPINFANRPAGVTGAEMDTALVQYDSASGALKLGDGTIVPGGAYRGAKATNTAGTVITNGVWNKVPMPTEDYDTDGIHDTAVNTSRVVVPAGVTQVKILGQGFSSGAGSCLRYARLLKNGAVTVAYLGGMTATVGGRNLSSGKLNVTAGDYFELELYTAVAGDSLSTTAGHNWLEMEIIA